VRQRRSIRLIEPRWRQAGTAALTISRGGLIVALARGVDMAGDGGALHRVLANIA